MDKECAQYELTVTTSGESYKIFRSYSDFDKYTEKVGLAGLMPPKHYFKTSTDLSVVMERKTLLDLVCRELTKQVPNHPETHNFLKKDDDISGNACMGGDMAPDL